MKSIEAFLGLQNNFSALFESHDKLHCTRQMIQGTCLLANESKLMRLKENKWGGDMIHVQTPPNASKVFPGQQ